MALQWGGTRWADQCHQSDQRHQSNQRPQCTIALLGVWGTQIRLICADFHGFPGWPSSGAGLVGQISVISVHFLLCGGQDRQMGRSNCLIFENNVIVPILEA
jgi:hypothetical protein